MTAPPVGQARKERSSDCVSFTDLVSVEKSNVHSSGFEGYRIGTNWSFFWSPYDSESLDDSGRGEVI